MKDEQCKCTELSRYLFKRSKSYSYDMFKNSFNAFYEKYLIWILPAHCLLLIHGFIEYLISIKEKKENILNILLLNSSNTKISSFNPSVSSNLSFRSQLWLFLWQLLFLYHCWTNFLPDFVVPYTLLPISVHYFSHLLLLLNPALLRHIYLL